MISHPGKTVSIYDLAEISGKARTKASTPVNIISGFSASGINPFQPDRWKDEDFILSQVTNRPDPEALNINPVSIEINKPNSKALNIYPVSVEIKRNCEVNKNASSSLEVESICPYPAAKAHLEKCKGICKKLSSSIITDTPVKEALRNQQLQLKLKEHNFSEKQKNLKRNQEKNLKIQNR